LREMLTRTVETAAQYTVKKYSKAAGTEVAEVVKVPEVQRRLIGCSLYKIKAVMIRTRELQTLVGVKKMVNKGKEKEAYVIFYRATTPGGALTRVQDADVVKLKPTEPVIILEGTVAAALNRESLAKRVDEVGLYELALINAAIIPPYDKDATGKPTSVADVPLEAAREEYGDLAKRIKAGAVGELPLVLDHVYCNVLGNEVPK
jgi:hypothetical protein